MKTQAEFLADWKKALQAKINAEEPFPGAWQSKDNEARLISLIKDLKRELDESRRTQERFEELISSSEDRSFLINMWELIIPHISKCSSEFEKISAIRAELEARYSEVFNEKVRIERRLADLRIVYSW